MFVDGHEEKMCRMSQVGGLFQNGGSDNSATRTQRLKPPSFLSLSSARLKTCPDTSDLNHLNPLIHQLLVIFVAASQLERIRQRGFALFHTGDDVGAA